MYLERILIKTNMWKRWKINAFYWIPLLNTFLLNTLCPYSKTPSLFCYISLLDRLMWNTFLLTNHSNFSVINFKLGVQIYYHLSWMLFFHTLATAFPIFCYMKTVCSSGVWKLRCMPTELCSPVPSASFRTQNNWLETKAD